MTFEREPIAQWAVETLIVAIEIGSPDPLPYIALDLMAREEALQLLNQMKNETDRANREFSKRVLRRANQIINDGIVVGSVQS